MVVGRVKNVLHVARTGSGAHPVAYLMGTGFKSSEGEADHSPPASAAVKKIWTCELFNILLNCGSMFFIGKSKGSYSQFNLK
jgi:hypothetical protein